MLRAFSVATLFLGLTMLPLTRAAASGTQSWQVCAGNYPGYSGFGLCASVTVTVTPAPTPGQYQVTIKVYNMSGTNGSYPGSALTVIGLDQINQGNYVAGSLQVTGFCPASNGTLVPCTAPANAWKVTIDKTYTSVNVDLAGATQNGTNSSIMSTCGHPQLDPANQQVFITSCDGIGPEYVTFTFSVTSDFNPADGQLYLKAQNGYPNGDGSTWCETGNQASPCTPVVVPEPTTVALLASGLSAFGAVGVARRRRKKVT